MEQRRILTSENGHQAEEILSECSINYLYSFVNNHFVYFFCLLISDHSNVPHYNQTPRSVPETYLNVKAAEPAHPVIKNSPYSARQSSTLIYTSNKGASKLTAKMLVVEF